MVVLPPGSRAPHLYHARAITCIETTSARSCIPHSQPHRPSRIPGWNDSARSLKDLADFWHRVWRDAGAPSAGVLFQIYCRAKSRFKYEVRRLRCRKIFIQRNKMANALASSTSRDFWKEVHRIHKHPRSCGSVPTVDGVSGDTHISELWSAKLQTLLNSRDILHPVKSSLSPSLNLSLVLISCRFTSPLSVFARQSIG